MGSRRFQPSFPTSAFPPLLARLLDDEQVHHEALDLRSLFALAQGAGSTYYSR
jgi:hypothetical protein